MGAEMEGAVPREDGPASSGWIATRIAKFEFRAHGWYERVLIKIDEAIKELKRSLKAYMQENERGPRDYVPEESPEELVRRRRREGAVVIIKEESHHKHSGNGGGSWQNNKILVGVAISVVSAAILGALATWATVSSLKTHIDDYITSNNERMQRQEQELNEVKKRVYRGAE